MTKTDIISAIGITQKGEKTMFNIGDRVKIGNAKYKSDLSNKLTSGRTGVISKRWYWLSGAVNYEVMLDEPYSFHGYTITSADFCEIDDALERIA